MTREKKNSNGDFGLCSGCGNSRCRECGGRRSNQQENEVSLKEMRSIAKPWVREGKAVGRITKGVVKDVGGTFVKEFGETILGRKNPYW
jgi:hypothetical protein